MSRSIERIYIGLPDHLANIVFWVERPIRINPLSHIPGGCDIIIEYSDGKVFGYDWIKSAYAYISSLSIGSAKRSNRADDGPAESSNGADDGSVEIKSIYGRKYSKDNFCTVPFKHVWKAGDQDTLEDALKRFDGNNTYNGGVVDIRSLL